jgi:cytochrome P450
VAIRRKALTDYTFAHSGGLRVSKDSIVCISAWDMMHDPTRYPSPDEFDGLRFVGDQRLGRDTRGTTFTDASREFPIWGFGARVW